MAGVNFGKLLESGRKKLGLSLKEFGGDRFDTGYLSKVEKGLTKPNTETQKLMIEKLGYNPSFITEFFIDEHDEKIQSTKETLDAHISKGRVEKAEKLIATLEADEQYIKGRFAKQYILTCKAHLADLRGEGNDKVLELLTDAINVSFPTFSVENIALTHLYSKLEIEIISMMATMHSNNKDLGTAIKIMKNLKKNMDRRFMDAPSKGAIYPMVIYNLTKYLGMDDQFEEAIKLCNVGKDFCIEIGSYAYLPLILANKAVYLYETGKHKESEELMIHCYHAFVLYEDEVCAEIAKNYALDKFGIVL